MHILMLLTCTVHQFLYDVGGAAVHAMWNERRSLGGGMSWCLRSLLVPYKKIKEKSSNM